MIHGTPVAAIAVIQRIRAVRTSRHHDLLPPVSPDEQLRPALKRAQTELDANLAEACDTHAADESTGKLIRLEELLTDAAAAAKEAISIRRRLGADRQRDSSPEAPATGAGASVTAPDESGEGIREFVDASGTLWRVWEVPAEQLNARARPGPFAGDFEGGWLAFESADASERRRLPGYPSDWYHLANENIEALCRDAQPVTRRKRGTSAETDEPRDDNPANAG